MTPRGPVWRNARSTPPCERKLDPANVGSRVPANFPSPLREGSVGRLGGFLALSRGGQLAGERRLCPPLAHRNFRLSFRLCGRRRRSLFLGVLEPNAELLQSSLEIVNPLTKDARTALLRTPKPLFEAGVSRAQHGLHLVTIGAGHNNETVSGARASDKSLPRLRGGWSGLEPKRARPGEDRGRVVFPDRRLAVDVELDLIPIRILDVEAVGDRVVCRPHEAGARRHQLVPCLPKLDVGFPD